MMKLIRIGLEIGTANAALGLATTAVPEGTAGSIYWNNHGSGGVVVHRRSTYESSGFYNYGPRYYRGHGVVTAPHGACARGYYGRLHCIGY